MGKIFKYLKEYAGAVFLIILLLVVQAYCDLSLPHYTSKIVDVGIQAGGIEHIAPDQMREETFAGLNIFLTDEEKTLMEEAYQLDDNGVYQLTVEDNETETIEKLDHMLGMPMVLLSSMTEQGMDLNTMSQMIGSGMVTISDMVDQAKEQMGDMSDSIIDQKALLFVQNEYEALGVDLLSYQNDYLLRTGGRMLLLSILMVVVAIFVGYLASYISAKIGMNLRSRMFRKVVSFSHNEMDQFSTASLITRCTNDIQQVQMVSVMLLRMVIYAPILGIGGVIKVASTRTGMGWIVGVAVGVIMVIVAVLMSIAMPRFKKMQVLVDKLNLVSREILTGISVIRAFSREEHEEKRFAAANKDLMSTQLFTSRVMTFMMPLMMMVMNCVSVLIIWVGAGGIDAGNLQVGDMMAFITYTMQIVMSFLMLTMISVMLPRAGVSAARIDEVLETDYTITDKEDTMDDKVDELKGFVTFHNVSFRYANADEDALKNISFSARPGKTTAVIGSTGSGKSTLVHMIPRFYDVSSGSITIDTVDIRDLSQHKLRDMIGFVPQKGVLFSGDIESNIKYSGDVSDEAMEEAAQIAQAMDFITEKEEGFNSSISQGGTNVSGGQKQRLSIARAIAKKPKIFLFDDSFSALDYKTDIVLRKALNENVKDATVIIVAQRISTILHADQIIVLDDGEIVGMGTHKELLENCEAYQEIAKSQLSEKELIGGEAS